MLLWWVEFWIGNLSPSKPDDVGMILIADG
jgi:hypothetical protein